MKQLFSKFIFMTLMLLLPQFAFSAGSSCGVNCQANFTTTEDVDEVVNEFVGNDQTRATVVRNSETGVFLVTLPDGSLLSVMPVGLTLRNQNMVQQREMAETDDGHLRLRSQSGLEIQVRNAFHNEAEAIGEMLRTQWTNMEWFRNRFEVESPLGVRMCLGPAMEIIPGQASGNTTISTDENGQLSILYQNGFQQRLHACAHDMTQLRDQVRSTLQQQLQVHTDGSFSVQVDGQLQRYRLAAALHWSGILDQPGFFTEQNRLHFRYRDGWKQEIVSLQ